MRGFEPLIRFPVCRFSKPMPSTTQPHLQYTSNCRTHVADGCHLILCHRIRAKDKAVCLLPTQPHLQTKYAI